MREDSAHSGLRKREDLQAQHPKVCAVAAGLEPDPLTRSQHAQAAAGERLGPERDLDAVVEQQGS